MRHDADSPELAGLEDRLRRRVGMEPSANLRTRVLGAVAVELRKPPGSSSAAGWAAGWWAAAAAGLLIMLNLSMVCASQNAFSIRHAGDPARQMAREIRVIQQLEAQQEGIFK
jgi:hypothetical protein